MNLAANALMVVALAVATSAASQSTAVPTNAPSSVADASTLTQPLSGRLFFSQQQRDKMDRARKRGEISIDGETEEPATSVLNGFVKRSDGQSAIWVDGQARFNVQSERVRGLQPIDVGGSANTVKVLSHSALAQNSVSNVTHSKKAVSKKSTRKRIPPRR